MGRGVATVLVLGLGACASGSATSSFSDGHGFGLKPAHPASAEELRSEAWDVKLGITPGAAQVTEAEDSWTVSNGKGTPRHGQFMFMVLRNPELGERDARAVVDLLRGEDKSRGLDTTDITEAEFLGRPGAMYASFPESGTTSVTLLTVAHKCIYVLSVTRTGDKGQVTDYFGELVSQIGTMSGGPADAPACR